MKMTKRLLQNGRAFVLSFLLNGLLLTAVPAVLRKKDS